MNVKVGDIIRRCTHFNYPIGQYLLVEKIRKQHIIVRGTSTNAFPLLKNVNIKVYKKLTLKISKEDLLRLSVPYLGTFYYEANKSFSKAADEQPEVVTFWAPHTSKKITFRLDYAERKIIHGKPCIRFYFIERLFRNYDNV